MSEDLELKGPYTFEVKREDGTSKSFDIPPGITLNSLIKFGNKAAGLSLTPEQILALRVHVLKIEALALVEETKITTPVTPEPIVQPEPLTKPEPAVKPAPEDVTPEETPEEPSLLDEIIQETKLRPEITVRAMSKDALGELIAKVVLAAKEPVEAATQSELDKLLEELSRSEAPAVQKRAKEETGVKDKTVTYTIGGEINLGIIKISIQRQITKTA
jgi:hypothetical protein